MIKVLDVPLNVDLTEFAEFLWTHEIPHRILEASDQQQLWVSRAVDPEKIATLYQMWRQGTDLSSIQVSFHGNSRGNVRSVPWTRVGLTLALILSSIGLSLYIGLGENFEALRLFTFTDVVQERGQLFSAELSETFRSGEVWRLLTPIFLHFSLMHILFNLLWVWVVGSKVEYFQGRGVLLGLVVFSGIVSNFSQFIVSGPMFGGMSGVVFALLAYAWLWDRRNPSRPVGLPPALMGFMVFWLALGYLGVLEGLGLGAIANTAHLVGMLCGLAYVPLAERFVVPRRHL